MKLNNIINLVKGRICVCQHLENLDINKAWAADLMSDVLASPTEGAILITSLAAPQIVRTAEMVGMVGIIIVSGKKADDTILNLAEELGIPIVSTDLSLFETCGILYYHGLRSN
ncbi:MAG: hypothetical protein DDT22_00360 [candidate division WS2 bacterium]|nr:hypothetical protein [Candidatus Lithacetigena glycinireducens]MBT9174699.1 hypothetical protein [Candidatus Lithacetigena glycinireducens]